MIMHGRTGFLVAALAALGAAPLAAQGYGSAVAMGDGVAFVSQSGNDYAPGFVYLYRTAGGQWSPAGRLAAPDSARADGFGSALALDGSTLMVSSSTSGDNKGKVYVFSGSGTQWKPAQQLSVPADSGRFGQAIVLAGNSAAISAPTADGGKGAVYLFKRSGSQWALDTMIQPADADEKAAFGASIAMQGDLMVIGAIGADSGTGTAYLYRKSGTGWTQEAKLGMPGIGGRPSPSRTARSTSACRRR
jgi:hypothetical protein